MASRRDALWAQPAVWVLAAVVLALVASLLVRAGHRGAGAPAVQVQVLNGSGAPEMAQQATLELRRHGFDVVAIGNADSQEYTSTLVLLRRGRMAVARDVAAALGRGEVLEQRDTSLLVDVTVVLGRDYARGRAPRRRPRRPRRPWQLRPLRTSIPS
jgi:hypothetical protein